MVGKFQSQRTQYNGIQRTLLIYNAIGYEMYTLRRRENAHVSLVRGQVTTSKLFLAISMSAWVSITRAFNCN